MVYRSAWLWTIGIYYFMIGIIRFVLLRGVRTAKKGELMDRLAHEYRVYRRCGWMMLLMNLVVSGMVVQMIWQNRSYDYPGLLIYASAAYTFYYFILAIVNVVAFRRQGSPILSAAKQLSVAAAVMAMYVLQVGMISTFGGEDESFRRTMNLIGGAIVCLYIIVASVRMIIHSTRKLRKI